LKRSREYSKDLLLRIKAVVEEIENTDNLSAVSNIRKLKAGGDYYRVRVGDYRIGFMESEGVITFVRVLHRKQIYRYFP
jgi:mRNA interferase RelE/StbE